MGMAGYARSGQGRGTAGVGRIQKEAALKAPVARGMERQVSAEQHAPAVTGATVDIPVVPPPARVPVLSPPAHVDLACTRPSAERKNVMSVEAHDLGTVRNVAAAPMKSLPTASPTLPQTKP